jgi:DNA-binding XRE family transcriptional regulator
VSPFQIVQNSFATYSLSTYRVHLWITYPMTITQSFGQKVRHFRNIKRLSQEELADLCGLHRTYIGSVERGERNITLINAERIANALEQPLASFFCGEI